MLSLLDLVKLTLGVVGYFVLAPAVGFLIRDNRRWQRRLFGLLVLMTSFQINKITLMIYSIEGYRGATKGFEISALDIVAGALLIGIIASRDRPQGRVPPGTFVYLLYVAMSYISIFHAPMPLYVNMAAWRFLEQVVVYMAAFYYLRDEDDWRVLIRATAAMLCLQACVVLKMKLVNHAFQINAWFEHQNALAMWSYMCGLPLLAVALGPSSKADMRWCLAGYGASAVIIIGALARASMLSFSAGTILVVLYSWCDGFTLRRVMLPAALALVACVGLAFTAQMIIFRFTESRNQLSSELRQMLIASSKLMLADSPIGIGWNNFALVINKPYSYGDPIDEWTISRGMNPNPNEDKPQPESHYWLILAENGYPGFYSYMLFISLTTFWVLRAAWRWRGTLVGVFLAGLAIALIITYAHSTIERCLTQTKNIAMWLIFLGVAVRLDTYRSAKASAVAEP